MRTVELSPEQDCENKTSIWKKSEKFRKGWKHFDMACGLENPDQERIIGGHEAAENEWPWQVRMQESVVFGIFFDPVVGCTFC